VLNVYMEEPPLVSDWRKLTETPNVVVVPFFISDGLHSYEDIPVLLGIASERSGSSSRRSGGVKERRLPSRRNHRGGRLGNRPPLMSHARGEIFGRNPYKIAGRSLFYAPSIGTDPGFADIIVEQTGNC